MRLETKAQFYPRCMLSYFNGKESDPITLRVWVFVLLYGLTGFCFCCKTSKASCAKFQKKYFAESVRLEKYDETVLFNGGARPGGLITDTIANGPTRRPARHSTHKAFIPDELIGLQHSMHKSCSTQIVAKAMPICSHDFAPTLLFFTSFYGSWWQTPSTRNVTTSLSLAALCDKKEPVVECYAAAPWKTSALQCYGTEKGSVFGTLVEVGCPLELPHTEIGLDSLLLLPPATSTHSYRRAVTGQNRSFRKAPIQSSNVIAVDSLFLEPFSLHTS